MFACTGLVAFIWSCANKTAHNLTMPLVPESLRVSQKERVSSVAAARGVQIYVCRAKKDDPARLEWVFKEPEAELFDHEGKIGKHYAGPTWESNDGSKVLGEHKTHVDAKDAKAIPLLLIEVKKREGEGMFSKVTSIQRVDTVGGKAPEEGCERTSEGREIHVPYTANYYFYVTKQ